MTLDSPSVGVRDLGHRSDLWLIPVSSPLPPTWVSANGHLLSADEERRRARYLRSDDGELFLSAHVAVRRILSKYTDIAPGDWRFRTGPHGRPEIANAEAPQSLRYNLSHTPGMVAVLVHDTRPAGVDVELVGRVADPLGMARTVFAECEREALVALAPAQREAAFYRLWTLKEAFIKATGQGLATGLQRFWFRGVEPGAAVDFGCAEEVETDPAAWSFSVQSLGPQAAPATYSAATASRGWSLEDPRPVHRIDATLHNL